MLITKFASHKSPVWHDGKDMVGTGVSDDGPCAVVLAGIQNLVGTQLKWQCSFSPLLVQVQQKLILRDLWVFV